MLRSVHAFLPVRGSGQGVREAFVDDPGRWLPEAEPVGADRWTMTVRAGHLSRTVTAQVGPPRQVGDSVWRPLSWTPTVDDDATVPVERFLPSLQGDLGLNGSVGNATLMLDGSYEPPGGLAGAALDSVALHQVAGHTLQQLLTDIADRLAAGTAPEPPPAPDPLDVGSPGQLSTGAHGRSEDDRRADGDRRR